MTLQEFTEQKYGYKGDLSFIERFNPNLPKDVEVPAYTPSFRNARNIAAQLKVTGGEISEEGRQLTAREADDGR